MTPSALVVASDTDATPSSMGGITLGSALVVTPLSAPAFTPSLFAPVPGELLPPRLART